MTLENYDPNVFQSSARQTVKLTLMKWDYQAEVTIDMENNQQGLGAINHAVCRYAEMLEEQYEDENGRRFNTEDDELELVLNKNNGQDKLICTTEGKEAEDWLSEMVVKAEITELHSGADSP